MVAMTKVRPSLYLPTKTASQEDIKTWVYKNLRVMRCFHRGASLLDIASTAENESEY